MAYKMVELNKEAAEKGYEMTNSEYYARLSWEETCKERDDLKYQVKALDALKNALINELKKQDKFLLDFCHFIGKAGYKINGYDDSQLNKVIEQFLNIQSAPSAQ